MAEGGFGGVVRSAVDVSEAEGIILRFCTIVDADGDCREQQNEDSNDSHISFLVMINFMIGMSD